MGPGSLALCRAFPRRSRPGWGGTGPGRTKAGFGLPSGVGERNEYGDGRLRVPYARPGRDARPGPHVPPLRRPGEPVGAFPCPPGARVRVVGRCAARESVAGGVLRAPVRHRSLLHAFGASRGGSGRFPHPAAAFLFAEKARQTAFLLGYDVRKCPGAPGDRCVLAASSAEGRDAACADFGGERGGLRAF